MRTRPDVVLLTAIAWASCVAPFAAPVAAQIAAPERTKPAAQPAVKPAARATADGHGRVVEHEGLKIVHLHGTPRERGHAMGELFGADIVRLVAAEYEYRFARREPLLATLRRGIERMIEYPEEFAAELDGLDAGITKSGASRRLDAFDRDLDALDLRLVNALDVVGMLGCSGFTVHGDAVDGGGVLTSRNFDWPYSGRHLVDDLVIVVQHPHDGVAHAAVTWPGYLGAVTGVNAEGVAVFLHVGSGRLSLLPRPGARTTASVARQILAASTADALAVARAHLPETCPPASYITRVVLPTADGTNGAECAFETDARKVVERREPNTCVTTNHFLAREDGRDAAKDSLDRFTRLNRELTTCLDTADEKVSPAEAMAALRAVQRRGRLFGTLHSFVFRADPWHFELRIAVPDAASGIVPAPSSGRVHLVPKAVLFGR